MYAKMCKSKGDVCVKWRDHTNGTCVYHCPGTMEYKPCASKEQPTCSLRHADSNAPVDNSGVDEGCFCPDGKFLFTPSDICTDSCDCIGPDGKPRQVGETWQSNCQDCSCNNVTLSVVCKPHKCPPSPSIICNDQGYVPVVQRNEHDLCCTETKCKCNVTHCPAMKPLCKTGYAPVIHMHEGRCCPKYTCEPNAVCVYNDTEYKPGMIVPQDTCKNCKCTDKVDPSTKHHIIECTAVKCDTHCAEVTIHSSDL
ncbi:intestinal mucin-like protein [Mobula hypostoma]|uniref:intestinal mucin-like protein n=1 Tax=Mobula hypostoma TaxID=723540 RepID=UPI002FC30285